jgi:hypothetical protein
LWQSIVPTDSSFLAVGSRKVEARVGIGRLKRRFGSNNACSYRLIKPTPSLVQPTLSLHLC